LRNIFLAKVNVILGLIVADQKLQGVFQILPDHSGQIWICSLSGLFYVNAAQGLAEKLPDV
jgi:hypothetical protein